MRCAIVYYSYDGHAATIARRLQQRFSADMLRLELQGERRRRGFRKYAAYILGRLYRKPAALKPYRFDPERYDLIVLGTPIWAEKPAPPLPLFVRDTPLSGKKVAIFCTSMAARPVYVERCAQLIADCDGLGAVNFTEKEAGGAEFEVWADALVQQM